MAVIFLQLELMGKTFFHIPFIRKIMGHKAMLRLRGLNLLGQLILGFLLDLSPSIRLTI